MTPRLDLHYRHLRLRRAIREGIDSFVAWILADHCCAHCGLVTPRLDLAMVYPLGLLCHACRKEHA
jgi:hypothetical protein